MPPSEKHREEQQEPRRALAALGELIVKWNRLENELVQLLINLSDGHRSAWVLAPMVGSMSLRDAIHTLSEDLPKPLRDHALHSVDFADRLREYRNYYVHGAEDVVETEDDGWSLQLSQLSTKRSIKVYFDVIPSCKITTLIGQMEIASEYIGTVSRRIQAYIYNKDQKDAILGTLVMPTLPEKLTKSRLDMKDQQS